MKTNQIAIVTAIILLFASNVFPQSWEKTKPFTLYAVDKDKNVSTVKVGIGTNSPLYPLEVKGKIVTDEYNASP